MRYGLGLPLLLLLASVTACGGSPSGGGGPSPEAPPSYAMLPDTMVCVLDRAAPTGLTDIAAKKDGDRVVIFSGGDVVDLETLHPVNLIAGYAGGESWLRQGEPIAFRGRTYAHIGGERRVGIEQLERIAEHRGILMFAGREDSDPYDALYLPTAPGCVFQPYVRDDLIRR